MCVCVCVSVCLSVCLCLSFSHLSLKGIGMSYLIYPLLSNLDPSTPSVSPLRWIWQMIFSISYGCITSACLWSVSNIHVDSLSHHPTLPPPPNNTRSSNVTRYTQSSQEEPRMVHYNMRTSFLCIAAAITAHFMCTQLSTTPPRIVRTSPMH